MKIVSKFNRVPIFCIFREISRQRALLSNWVGSGRFIVLSDSANPEMVIKLYFNVFRFFLKVLEPIECRRADPYMTANRIFVRFATRNYLYCHSCLTIGMSSLWPFRLSNNKFLKMLINAATPPPCRVTFYQFRSY